MLCKQTDEEIRSLVLDASRGHSDVFPENIFFFGVHDTEEEAFSEFLYKVCFINPLLTHHRLPKRGIFRKVEETFAVLLEDWKFVVD